MKHPPFHAYRIMTWFAEEFEKNHTLYYLTDTGTLCPIESEAKIFYDSEEVRLKLIVELTLHTDRWYMVERGSVTTSINWEGIEHIERKDFPHPKDRHK